MERSLVPDEGTREQLQKNIEKFSKEVCGNRMHAFGPKKQTYKCDKVYKGRGCVHRCTVLEPCKGEYANQPGLRESL